MPRTKQAPQPFDHVSKENWILLAGRAMAGLSPHSEYLVAGTKIDHVEWMAKILDLQYEPFTSPKGRTMYGIAINPEQMYWFWKNVHPFLKGEAVPYRIERWLNRRETELNLDRVELASGRSTRSNRT